MELFDIVDADGIPTGAVAERSEAHRRGLRHRTAHIWVIRRESGRVQVLLQKRAANKDSFPGRFDTSSAGHIQAGDEPLESAIRELGIRAEAEQLHWAGKFAIAYEKEFYGQMFCDNEVSFVYVYDSPVDISALQLQQEEVERVEWFDLEEVLQEVGQHNQKFCVPPDGLKTLVNWLNG